MATRISHLSALVALTGILIAAPAAAQDGPAGPSSPAPAQASSDAHPLARWLDAQAVTVSARWNYIEDARDRTLQNRMQAQTQIRGRFKLDEDGRYSVHAGLFTGDAFTSGWNPTGIGTGEGTANIYLKHLFVAAEPWDGIELQYGSMAPERGQSTEITTYDNDAYITAGRASISRPDELFFDDITVSAGYVGYLDTAFVFDRTGAFSRHNYWQFLASKEILSGLTLSTDYSVIEEDGYLRQGARWKTGSPLVDTVAGEYAVRLRGGSHQTAFAFSGEKKVEAVTIALGYANVDPVYGRLNGDAYLAGDRLFTTGSFPLPLDLRATWFVQKEISPPVTSRNDVRVDLAVQWDVLKTLKRARILP